MRTPTQTAKTRDQTLTRRAAENNVISHPPLRRQSTPGILDFCIPRHLQKYRILDTDIYRPAPTQPIDDGDDNSRSQPPVRPYRPTNRSASGRLINRTNPSPRLTFAEIDEQPNKRQNVRPRRRRCRRSSPHDRFRTARPTAPGDPGHDVNKVCNTLFTFVVLCWAMTGFVSLLRLPRFYPFPINHHSPTSSSLWFPASPFPPRCLHPFTPRLLAACPLLYSFQNPDVAFSHISLPNLVISCRPLAPWQSRPQCGLDLG